LWTFLKALMTTTQQMLSMSFFSGGIVKYFLPLPVKLAEQVHATR